MNVIELEQLSHDVAELEGIKAFEHETRSFYPQVIWLYQDSARCFDLMVKHDIRPHQNYLSGTSWAEVIEPRQDGVFERWSSHNNDRSQATRVAILKARLAMGEIGNELTRR